jgi:hypothetical protein
MEAGVSGRASSLDRLNTVALPQEAVMSPILGAVGLVLALAGFLSLIGLSDVPLYMVGISQLHTLPILNAIPPAWLYLLLGMLLLLFAGGSQAAIGPGGDHY